MKKTKQFLAVLLAMMMAAVFVPTFSFAAEDVQDEADQPVVEQIDEADDAVVAEDEVLEAAAAAKSAKMTITVNSAGAIAKAKDGSIMFNKSITVKDLNKDGKLTYDEALVAAHKAYNKADGYVIADDGWVLKLWGNDCGSYLFFINGKGLSKGVTVDTVKKGDKLYASANLDLENWADWYTNFDKESVKVYAKRDITLNLTGFQGMALNPEATAVKGVKIGLWKKGEFVALEGVTTDKDGNATFTLPKKGTYYVTASGEVDDVDWQGKAIKAPIMAPVCKVVVKKAKAAKAVNVKMTVNNKGYLDKTKKGKVMANQTVKVKDLDKNGKLTFDEALVAAHKAYCKDGVKGYAGGDTGWVTKLWGVDSGNNLFFINGKGLSKGVLVDTVKKGDNLYASVNADNDNYADWYTSFDKATVKTKVKKNVTLKLTGFQGMAWSPEIAPVVGVKIGLWKKGEFVELEGVTTDGDGNATFSFPKKGTYYVTAFGKVPDYNWQGEAIDAPIMAPFCKVVVKK